MRALGTLGRTIGVLGRSGLSDTTSGDVTAPTLSSAIDGTPTEDGATGAGVTTDEGNGTLYWAVVTNGGSCTDAQLKAGSGGNIVAGVAGNQAVSGTGAQVIGDITGLTASTAYQIKFLHRDAAGNDSAQASVDLTTTAVTDPSFASVKMLAFNETGKADTNTEFADQSGTAHTLTAVGGAQWDTSIGLGSDCSAQFDGNGDSVTAADSAEFDLTGDFTLEFFVRPASVVGFHGMVCKGAAGAEVWVLIMSNGTTLAWWASAADGTWGIASAQTIGTIAADTDYHVALVRSGNTYTPYLNGVAGSGVVSSASAPVKTAAVLRLGNERDNGATGLNGRMRSFRLTVGVARYTENFTPPTTPFPSA